MRGLIGDLRIKTYLVNQSPAETCQVFGKNFSGQLYHPILEAKVVTPNGFAFSLMTEFIENADLLQDKQDCELKAFYRLSKRLKARFPRLPLCLLLDGLFAGGPAFRICADPDWKYLIVLQEGDLLNLQRSFAAVTPHLPPCASTHMLAVKQRSKGGTRVPLGKSVCELLEKIATLYVGVPITIFLDNARYQKCVLVMEKAQFMTA
jgi:hypothetical protein